MEQVNKLQGDKGLPHFVGGERASILVVEDDRTHRSLMDKILQECEFKTTMAENGLVALARIDEGHHFDLIIMDWDMPELNGLDTVRELRAREMHQGLRHIPVIAFTSHRKPGDREKCLEAGMDAYLPKDAWMPKWRETLVDNLQGLIAGNFDLRDFGSRHDASHFKRHSSQVSESVAGDIETADVIDFKVLEQAASLLKDELPIGVEEYLEDAAAYIGEIKQGIEEGDIEKVARGSHPLKSNSKGFGLMALSRVAELINEHAREGDLEKPKSLFKRLQSNFGQAEKSLRGFLKRLDY